MIYGLSAKAAATRQPGAGIHLMNADHPSPQRWGKINNIHLNQHLILWQ